jgi:undecaprenyl-diphosphatase
MSILQALILGLLQGIAEFLPISSSGHLLLGKHWFGLDDIPLIFDLALHIATLGAVVVVFRSTIIRLILVLWRLVSRTSAPSDREDHHYIILILIATVITALMGFSLKDVDLGLRYVYIGFLYTSALLILGSWLTTRAASKASVPETTQSWLQRIGSGVVLGLFQGLAVLPGISRSGSTISAALFCGISRQRAGELSFLLSIPAIVGGFLLVLHEGQGQELLSQVEWTPFMVAFATSFISGYLALRLLLKLVKEMKLYYFAIYLIPLALLGLLGVLP